MADSNEAICAKTGELFKRQTQLVANLLDEAKAQGDMCSELDRGMLAEFLFDAWEGALMRMKTSHCARTIDTFMAVWPRIVSSNS